MPRLKCITSRVQRIDTRRVTTPVAEERLRGRPAARMRERILLRDNYLCVTCLAEGRITEAVIVDHIVPLHLGGSAVADSNQQSLCQQCSDDKTALEQATRDGKCAG